MNKRERTMKRLDLAILRIRTGRPQNVPVGQRISISLVAREAGLSPSTIHTSYPEIAERIRVLRNDSKNRRREIDTSEVERLRAELKKARARIKQLTLHISKQASRDATIAMQNALLEAAKSNPGKVTVLRRSHRGQQTR